MHREGSIEQRAETSLAMERDDDDDVEQASRLQALHEMLRHDFSYIIQICI